MLRSQKSWSKSRSFLIVKSSAYPRSSEAQQSENPKHQIVKSTPVAAIRSRILLIARHTWIGLDPILQFESIARLESLKDAAEELHLSQPAVTQSLNKLEKNLVVQLCVRSRASFSLTEAGRRLFKVSQEIKDRLKHFESFLNDGSEFNGLLSIGVIDNFQNKSFEDAVKKTIQQFPKMRLSIQVQSAEEVQRLVSSGEFDVGFGIFNRKLDHLTYRTIGRETIRHYIAENHSLYCKRDISREDVKMTNTDSQKYRELC